MTKMNNKHKRRTPGQALVEFALAATLIFFLISAAVDLGLLFISVQALRTAAQEGANFGSYPRITESGSGVSSVDLRYDDIAERVRFTNGENTRAFINLLDLNGNGVDDGSESSVIDPKNSNSFIYVQLLKDRNFDGDPTNDGNAACATTTPRTDMRDAGRDCYIQVTVKYTYNFIFPLAPVFGDQYTIQSSVVVPIRSSYIG